jgi:hypothetical protein
VQEQGSNQHSAKAKRAAFGSWLLAKFKSKTKKAKPYR